MFSLQLISIQCQLYTTRTNFKGPNLRQEDIVSMSLQFILLNWRSLIQSFTSSYSNSKLPFQLCQTLSPYRFSGYPTTLIPFWCISNNVQILLQINVKIWKKCTRYFSCQRVKRTLKVYKTISSKYLYIDPSCWLLDDRK